MNKMTYLPCSKCGVEYVTTRLKVHELKCNGIPKAKKIVKFSRSDTYIFENGTYFCRECRKSFSTDNGVSSHYWRMHTLDGQKHHVIGGCSPGKAFIRKAPAWNKGLTKETNQSLVTMGASLSKTLREKVENGTHRPPKQTEEFKNRLSIEQSLRNRGGKCKWFDVDGIKVQGTWERNLALKFNEEHVKWTKPKTNTDVWKYSFDGKMKSYSPDFFLPEYNIWLEVKGYWWGNDKEKMNIVFQTYSNRILLIIEKDQYNEILKIGMIKFLEKYGTRKEWSRDFPEEEV